MKICIVILSSLLHLSTCVNLRTNRTNPLVAWGAASVRIDDSTSSFKTNRTAPNVFSSESTTPCVSNEHGQPAAPCDIEANSRNMIRKWVPQDATVLEIGARYGSVACVIAAKQQQSGKIVAVEPDPQVSNALAGNLQRYGCNVNILLGVVGTTPVSVVPVGVSGYGTHTVAAKGGDGMINVPAYPLAQVEQKFNMHFDTLVADCEGCVPTLFSENPQLAQQANLIVIESHNEAETHVINDLQARFGFQLIDQVARQRVLKRAR